MAFQKSDWDVSEAGSNKSKLVINIQNTPLEVETCLESLGMLLTRRGSVSDNESIQVEKGV